MVFIQDFISPRSGFHQSSIRISDTGADLLRSITVRRETIMDMQNPVSAESVIDDLERRLGSSEDGFGPAEDEVRARSVRARAAELHGVRAAVLEGDRAATERQHAKGKLTVRERIELLMDEGLFHEVE